MTNNNEKLEKKLDTLIELSRLQVALELNKKGLSKEFIAKRLHLAKSKVVEMLRGIEKEK